MLLDAVGRTEDDRIRAYQRALFCSAQLLTEISAFGNSRPEWFSLTNTGSPQVPLMKQLGYQLSTERKGDARGPRCTYKRILGGQ
jgi:hypothetical protein